VPAHFASTAASLWWGCLIRSAWFVGRFTLPCTERLLLHDDPLAFLWFPSSPCAVSPAGRKDVSRETVPDELSALSLPLVACRRIPPAPSLGLRFRGAREGRPGHLCSSCAIPGRIGTLVVACTLTSYSSQASGCSPVGGPLSPVQNNVSRETSTGATVRILTQPARSGERGREDGVRSDIDGNGAGDGQCAKSG